MSLSTIYFPFPLNIMFLSFIQWNTIQQTNYSRGPLSLEMRESERSTELVNGWIVLGAQVPFLQQIFAEHTQSPFLCAGTTKANWTRKLIALKDLTLEGPLHGKRAAHIRASYHIAASVSLSPLPCRLFPPHSVHQLLSLEADNVIKAAWEESRQKLWSG